MAVVNFTDRWLKSIVVTKDEKQKDFWDDLIEGLGVRVSYGGRKAWVIGYRIGGRFRRMTFAKYPDTSLSKARMDARGLLVKVASGQDPADQKRANRMAETFGELCSEYLEHHAKPNKKSWKEDERSLTKEVLSIWKTRKANSIKRREIIALLDDVVRRGAPVQANRLLALLRKVFNFGIEREILEINPCWAVRRPTDEKPRQGQKVLSLFEIRKIWNAIEAQEVLVSGIFKLRLLTAQRGLEIRSMRWSDIDLEARWWTIPGHVTKNKLAHRVPLSSQALQIIENIRLLNIQSEFVFPSPVNNEAHINHIHKAMSRIKENLEIDFTDRDFRRTAASYMTGQLQTPRLVVSKILNHVESGITRVYDRHSYDLEKRNALEKWGNYLDQLVSKKEIKSDLKEVREFIG